MLGCIINIAGYYFHVFINAIFIKLNDKIRWIKKLCIFILVCNFVTHDKCLRVPLAGSSSSGASTPASAPSATSSTNSSFSGICSPCSTIAPFLIDVRTFRFLTLRFLFTSIDYDDFLSSLSHSLTRFYRLSICLELQCYDSSIVILIECSRMIQSDIQYSIL